MLIVWITFLGEMIISLFLLKQGRCHVVIIMSLICVAHDTNLFVLPASIMRCLFTYVGLLWPVYSCRLDQKLNENCH